MQQPGVGHCVSGAQSVNGREVGTALPKGPLKKKREKLVSTPKL